MSGRRLGLLPGLALVVAANAVVLARVAWNRGAVDARVELTERELSLPYAKDDEDTGLEVRLRWRQPDRELESTTPWLGRDTLRSLGFDVSMPPDDPKAESFYRHALPREAFVVLEMEGPAWKQWFEAYKQERSTPEAQGCCQESLEKEERMGSRLFAVTAGRDARALRTAYPDRGRYLVLPAEIRAAVRRQSPDGPPVLDGDAELRSGRAVQVPLPLRPVLDAVRREPADPQGRKAPRYRFTLATGRRCEPWLEKVERLPP
jgi:Domain of unknown function (DUF4824)